MFHRQLGFDLIYKIKVYYRKSNKISVFLTNPFRILIDKKYIVIDVS